MTLYNQPTLKLNCSPASTALCESTWARNTPGLRRGVGIRGPLCTVAFYLGMLVVRQLVEPLRPISSYCMCNQSRRWASGFTAAASSRHQMYLTA
ncbi:Uncharacterized protein LW94_12299 [Fusarium fujikuroi]|nr:Uncharacterized protein Y057_3592 [Fusarium fujikuroi]KLP23336.1 Uncharacterized protein LW94_12299 [Fusarium fujikuroi]